MPFLDFELNEPPGIQEDYRNVLGQHSLGIRKSVEFLQRAIQLMMAVQTNDDQHYHGVVFMLARHAAEELDATSVLVAEGCIAPCKSHLRSAFEAENGVLYILKADSERRALAYLVRHARERIRWYDKTDPNSPAGKELRSQFINEGIATSVQSTMPSFDFDSAKNKLDGMLKKPPYAVVYDEWQRIKKETKRHPAWHALFGGPKTIRDLSFHLDRGFWYEYLYSEWSGHIHAANGVYNVGPRSDDPTGDLKAIRPLRHPDGLKEVCNLGQGMAICLGNTLAQQYLSQVGQDDLKDLYIKEIRPLNERLKNVKIKADWQ